MTPQSHAPTPPPPTVQATNASIFDELFRRWIAYIDVRPKSTETYTKAVRQFFRWLQGQNITQPQRDDILRYRDWLKKTKKPTTVQLYIVAVRQFFSWLEAEGAYKNISTGIKGAKTDRYHRKDHLTADQVKNVLGGIDRHHALGQRDYTILALMATGGLRTIEIVRADVGDIGDVGGEPVLYLQSKGKDEKTDYVKIPPAINHAIKVYLEQRGTPQDAAAPLFAGTGNRSQGKRLTPRSVSRIVKNRLRNAGHDSARITAHSLRHSAVTLALQGGQSLQDVQQFARHTNITTTMIYAHNIDRAANTCVKTLAKVIL